VGASINKPFEEPTLEQVTYNSQREKQSSVKSMPTSCIHRAWALLIIIAKHNLTRNYRQKFYLKRVNKMVLVLFRE
jgi:hypothetical protein